MIYRADNFCFFYFRHLKIGMEIMIVCDKFICTNCLVPVGKNKRYGHPNKEVLNNLEDSKTYRTDQDGSVMFKFKDNKLKIGTCLP